MPRPRPDRWPAALTGVCGAILILSFLRVAWSAHAWDPTYDEYWHLLWSERALLEGNFDREYPNFISTTPITQLNAGAQALARTAGVSDPQQLTTASRLPTVLGYALLLWLVYAVGRAWLNPQAGLLATTLTALDANVATHSALATVDTFFAAVTLGLLWAALRFLDKPSPGSAARLTLALGLGFVIKLSSVLFLPTVAVVLVWGLWRAGRRDLWWRLPLYGLGGILGVSGVLGCAYHFQRMGVALGDMSLASEFMQSLAASLPWLRLPVPEAFLTGFDQTLYYERGMQWNTVILDRYFSDGVWYYFPVTALFKTPLAVLMLLAMALVMLARAAGAPQSGSESPSILARLQRHWHGLPVVVRHGAWILGLQWLIFAGYFNFVFRTHVGLRYIVMCLPLVYLACAAILQRLPESKVGQRLLLSALLIAVLEHVPYGNNVLAFSNALIPDKSMAYRVLTDSNIDWDQNYRQVYADALDQYPDAAVNPVHIMPGKNLLRLNDLAGVFRNFEQHRWIREHLTPTTHLGHTHLLYDVNPTQFMAFLEARNRLPALAPGLPCEPVVNLTTPLVARQIAAELTGLCMAEGSNLVRVVLRAGTGTVGRPNTNGLGCEGYALSAGQQAVFLPDANRSRLCVSAGRDGAEWEISAFVMPRR